MILCFLHSCLSLSVRPPVTLPVGLGHVDVGFPPTYLHAYLRQESSSYGVSGELRT
jgi:hypothetical protein